MNIAQNTSRTEDENLFRAIRERRIGRDQLQTILNRQSRRDLSTKYKYKFMMRVNSEFKSTESTHTAWVFSREQLFEMKWARPYSMAAAAQQSEQEPYGLDILMPDSEEERRRAHWAFSPYRREVAPPFDERQRAEWANARRQNEQYNRAAAARRQRASSWTEETESEDSGSDEETVVSESEDSDYSTEEETVTGDGIGRNALTDIMGDIDEVKDMIPEGKYISIVDNLKFLWDYIK